MIQQIRSSAKRPVLLLDAGDTLTGVSLANSTEGKVIVEAMNAMHYDAMGLGTLDLKLGLQVLLERAVEATFPFLSCNLVDQQGEPLFSPYTVVERDGARFGIIGVSARDVLILAPDPIPASVLDPLTSVKQVLPEVRAQSDVVILLSRLGVEEDKALAKSLQGVAAIVGGKSLERTAPPVWVAGVALVQAGYNGEWLGRLDIGFDAQGKMVEAVNEIIALGPELADDPRLVAIVDSYR